MAAFRHVAVSECPVPYSLARPRNECRSGALPVPSPPLAGRWPGTASEASIPRRCSPTTRVAFRPQTQRLRTLAVPAVLGSATSTLLHPASAVQRGNTGIPRAWSASSDRSLRRQRCPVLRQPKQHITRRACVCRGDVRLPVHRRGTSSIAWWSQRRQPCLTLRHGRLHQRGGVPATLSPLARASMYVRRVADASSTRNLGILVIERLAYRSGRSHTASRARSPGALQRHAEE